MSRYALILSYDGTEYNGWQIQPNGVTIQGEIQKALYTITQKSITVTGAGRTDTGVHARNMVAHLDIDEENEHILSSDGYKINKLLPKDISIRRTIKVPSDFHSRFLATQRCYHYYVTLAPSPFTRRYETALHRELDFESMNLATKALIGEKDFTTFSKAHTDVKTHICRVTEAKWIQTSPFHWHFKIIADRFLRNMVRSIVGTLFDVGRGKIRIEEFTKKMVAKDRSLATNTAPAEGLFLEWVSYPFQYGVYL